jgi:hypothetical protein
MASISTNLTEARAGTNQIWSAAPDSVPLFIGPLLPGDPREALRYPALGGGDGFLGVVNQPNYSPATIAGSAAKKPRWIRRMF